jgi:hypothetical protein
MNLMRGRTEYAGKWHQRLRLGGGFSGVAPEDLLFKIPTGGAGVLPDLDFTPLRAERSAKSNRPAVTSSRQQTRAQPTTAFL